MVDEVPHHKESAVLLHMLGARLETRIETQETLHESMPSGGTNPAGNPRAPIKKLLGEAVQFLKKSRAALAEWCVAESRVAARAEIRANFFREKVPVVPERHGEGYSEDGDLANKMTDYTSSLCRAEVRMAQAASECLNLFYSNATHSARLAGHVQHTGIEKAQTNVADSAQASS